MINLIDNFFKLIKNSDIEIYNEFSFQHEFGIFLREKLPGKKIQFKRNVTHFNFDKNLFEKKEIDICIYSGSDLEPVIELKYPRNGQVPETMYTFCKDISFLEQLKDSGFKEAYFIAIADDPLLYSGKSSGIYSLFRSGKDITGIIGKPTGSKDTSVSIAGCYSALWEEISGDSKYCAIQIGC